MNDPRDTPLEFEHLPDAVVAIERAQRLALLKMRNTMDRQRLQAKRRGQALRDGVHPDLVDAID